MSRRKRQKWWRAGKLFVSPAPPKATGDERPEPPAAPPPATTRDERTTELVPRVMLKSHMDGDPKPRPDEIAIANAMRVEQGVDDFLIGIALPNPEAGMPMKGFDLHWWEVVVEDGVPKCRPATVNIEVVPNDDPRLQP